MEVEIDKKNGNSLVNRIDCNEVTRVLADELSYNQFYQSFMSKNLPVVITGSEIKTETSSLWFMEGEFKLEKMKETIGDHEVPVANCSKQYFDSHEKIKMSFSDFVNYWNGDREAGNFYLKDFHLKQEIPELNFYKVPLYFSSDWLNEYLIGNKKDDYRFIYIGPKDSWQVFVSQCIFYRMNNCFVFLRTPFHSDVFGSYSWSASIYGRKEWLILPPDEELKLKDSLGNLPFTVSREALMEKNVKHFELIQESGETLFVPSRWYHQVKNIDDSVSVNHNCFNACNIEYIVEAIVDSHKNVEKEISDCKDMEDYKEHCQLMLKASFGMDFRDLVELLIFIADRRINLIKNKASVKMFNEYILGTNHALNDLEIILKVFGKLQENEALNKLKSIAGLVIEYRNKMEGAINECR